MGIYGASERRGNTPRRRNRNMVIASGEAVDEVRAEQASSRLKLGKMINNAIDTKITIRAS